MYRITSTVGIDVIMEGCGHNDTLITRQMVMVSVGIHEAEYLTLNPSHSF